MAEEAAHRKMKAAETKLRVSIKDLNDKCDNATDVNPSELWATRKIATLAGHWSSFEKDHTAYVELLTLDDTVEAYEHFGRVSKLYEDVVEKGSELLDSRQPPRPVAPHHATAQEQYDLAAHERKTTITEADGIVAEVVSHIEEKGEETPASLLRQREKLAKAEELLNVAHVFTTAMAGLKPEHAERDLVAGSAKKMEVVGEMYERRKLPSSGGVRRDNLSLRCEWQTNVTGKSSDVQEEVTRAEADYLEELEEWAESEIPGSALFAEKLADAEQSKVENSTIDQADEVKKEQVEISNQKAEMHTMTAEAVQIENNKQAAILEVEMAEKEDTFPYEPGPCACGEAMEDQKAEEVEASSKPEMVVMSSKTLLDEKKMKFEEEEHSVADLKIDKEVDGLDIMAKQVVEMMKEKKHGVSDLMIDKKGKEVVDFKDKEKLNMKDEAEAKLIHTEKAEAVEEVRMPRLRKRDICYKIEKRMEEKVIRDEKERHELSPLEADKLLPPERDQILWLLIDKSAAGG